MTKNAVSAALKRRGVRQKLVSPANAFTGRPTFPLRSASLAQRRSVASLRGGIQLRGKDGRKARISRMKAVVRKGSAPAITARLAGRKMRIFKVRGAKVKRDLDSGVLNLRGGTARLTGKAAKLLRKRLKLKGAKPVAPGKAWGRISVFAARNTPAADPVAETPVEPAFLERPDGAADLTSATIKWRVRESFIRYVAVGDGTSVAGGVTADPPEVINGAAPLVYSFNFPFADGWAQGAGGPSAIHGSGEVGFRHCGNTINFTVADPEIELNGDDSRLIFRVNGTDGTAFPNSRAVMVKLIPDLATKTTVGDTTTLTDIPAYIPETATGIFADFYPPFPGSVDSPSAEFSRFGSLTVSYTTG